MVLGSWNPAFTGAQAGAQDVAAESRGSAYAEGQFLVSAPKQFAAEMLEARLHPLIMTGADLAIQYTVAPPHGEPCPRCEAQDTHAAAS